MSPFVRLRHVRLPIPIAITGGLAVAVMAGALIGSGDWGTIKRLTLLLFVVSYLLFLHSYTWQFGLLIAALGLTHVGFGFKINVLEMSALLAGVLVAATWWRKQVVAKPQVMELFSFRVFSFCLMTWVVYSTAHAIYTVMDPFNPYEFAVKNFAKTAVVMTGPWALLLYFMYRPKGVEGDDNMPATIIIIGLVGLLFNIVVRSWGIWHGVYNPDLSASLGDDAKYFTIPGLDLMEDPYALRGLTPVTATSAAVLLGSTWLKRRSAIFRFLVGLLLFLSFVGAILSGGRAAVIFVFCLTGIALWMRAYYRTVLGTLAAGLFAVIVLNLIPGMLEIVPPMLQRSLQAVVFTEESEFARLSISDSTQWRRELVARAWAEWLSDRRIFWFGRGTYKFGNEDILAQQLNVSQGAMETSLRRGATHSLVTDLLVVYGLSGFVFYCAMMVSMIWFFWRAYRHPSIEEAGRLVTLLCLVVIGFNFAYDLIGGGMTPTTITWTQIALFGYFYRLEQKRKQEPRLQPREVRPVSNHKRGGNRRNSRFPLGPGPLALRRKAQLNGPIAGPKR